MRSLILRMNPSWMILYMKTHSFFVLCLFSIYSFCLISYALLNFPNESSPFFDRISPRRLNAKSNMRILLRSINLLHISFSTIIYLVLPLSSFVTGTMFGQRHTDYIMEMACKSSFFCNDQETLDTSETLVVLLLVYSTNWLIPICLSVPSFCFFISLASRLCSHDYFSSRQKTTTHRSIMPPTAPPSNSNCGCGSTDCTCGDNCHCCEGDRTRSKDCHCCSHCSCCQAHTSSS